MKRLIEFKYYFLIVIICILWIVFFNELIQILNQGKIFPDSISYQEASSDLFLNFKVHKFRPILMAFLYGIPYIFSDSDDTIFSVSFYINIFCWISSFILLFQIFKDFQTPKKAFIYTVICVFFIGNTALVFHLLSETLYVFVIIIAFYFFIKYFKINSYKYLAIALSFFILSILIKPGSKLIAIVFFIYFLKVILKNYHSKYSFLIYGSLLLVVLHCSLMKKQFGNFTLTYIDSITYYSYLGTKAIFIKNGEIFHQRNNQRADFIFMQPEKKQKEIAFDDFKNQLYDNKLNLIKAYVSDLIENTKTGSSVVESCKNINNSPFFNISQKILYFVSKWQNRIFCILGIYLCFYFIVVKRNSESFFTLVSFFILFTIFISAISCGQGDRFNAITFPFAMILIGKFLQEKKIF